MSPVTMHLLDRFAPTWQFREVHRISVRATPDRAYRAIREVTAREIRFFRALTWLRRLGRSGPESILNPPPDVPILDVALRSGFVLLGDDPSRELVAGMVVMAPRRSRGPRPLPEYYVVAEPGYAKAALGFLIDRAEGGCTVTTETRVHTTDAATQRRFAAYWFMIYPGSALIRRMWLRAIKRRAENDLSQGG